jgi:hypothetical protein
MFNFDAQQIFVLHPRQGGGGIVSAILSLDESSAALNFKNLSVNQKAQDMKSHFVRDYDPEFGPNAHPYNFINFGHPFHLGFMEQADLAPRYMHKGHFYELFDEKNKQLLEKMSHKLSVGISFTEECIEKVDAIRTLKYPVDHYQKWIYDNQKTLLPQHFNIDCRHTIEFRDLLEETKFLDHIAYCCEVFDLKIDMTLAQDLVQGWHKKIIKETP